ncbi:beta-ketoacyl synthase chain length factor [Massilia sp. CF038]|uniref:beta-ketoacyl synthase chain length factor n=1 Tax=Massilia sp. CF038 TaxID=1881045 RepID=UPI000917258C|nr:beta-ketoacyl synthase chain length factor [Massilia sp. CF038]SHG68126.1 Beta-ketoacyl synthase, N-terminal domain [Massilia sp. CF038]
MFPIGLKFSIAAHSAWAPGITTPQEWDRWSAEPTRIGEGPEPSVRAMPAMLRRRAGFLGKMALEVAYECLGGRTDVPTVFCSRHGEVTRAVELLGELARGEALSPTTFGLAVHNASAGLFSIARVDRANHIALAAGQATIEHGVVEACGLLADGAPMVLLVAYDAPLPDLLAQFEDCDEQPYAWAWLMTAPAQDVITLSLEAALPAQAAAAPGVRPPGLDVLLFQRSGARLFEHVTGAQRWRWSRDA